MYLNCTARDAACASMAQQYPTRFSLSGLIELTYSDYFFDIPSSSSKETLHSSFIEQRYGIAASGYIYHPRLAVFNAGIKFTDNRQLSGIGGHLNTQTWGYDVLLTFLPYRPISLALYAGNTDYTISPDGDFINNQFERTQNVDYTYYGARLKIAKYPYPFTRLEFLHEERGLFATVGNPGTVKTDQLTLDVRGSLRFMQTSYQALLQYYDYSGPVFSYTAKEARLNMISTLKKGVHLYNSLNYSDIDFYKLFSFNANLQFERRKNFNQHYSYLFQRSESRFAGSSTQDIQKQETKLTVNSLSGSWTYKFFNSFISSLALNYGLRDENSENAKFYGINFSLTYRRSLLGLNFSPRYRLLVRNDDLRGKLLEHNLLLDIITKKLRFGTVYSNYSLTISKEESRYRQISTEPGFDEEGEEVTTKLDSVIHDWRTGVRGSVPGQLLSRAQWNIEAEYFSSSTDVERPRPVFFFDDNSFFESPTEKFQRKIERYTLLGNISYPIGWASIFFSAGSSVGKSNDVKLKRIYVENRVQYPIRRNLILLAKWKKIWEKFAEASTVDIEEYSVSAEYRLGRTTLSADGIVLRTKNENIEIYVRRFFLRFRRTF
jgi:hypothetical protein